MTPGAADPQGANIFHSAVEVFRRGRAALRFDFDPARPVAEPLLRQLLERAALAPSPFNLQPWRFLVVQEPQNRRRLRSCGLSPPRAADAPVIVVVLGYQNPHHSHLEAVLTICRELGAASPAEAAELRGRALAELRGRASPALWATRWAMLAAGTLTLAAEAAGLNALVLDSFDEPALRDAFGIPADHSVGCLVALGHAAKPAPFPGRFPLDEVCYQEHFGQPWPSDPAAPEG